MPDPIKVPTPSGYEVTDHRHGSYPYIEMKALEFARTPTIQLDTVERSVRVDGEYVTRRFWGVRCGSVSAMDHEALGDFIAALEAARMLAQELRAQEIASQPLAVLDAFAAKAKEDAAAEAALAEAGP